MLKYLKCFSCNHFSLFVYSIYYNIKQEVYMLNINLTYLSITQYFAICLVSLYPKVLHSIIITKSMQLKNAQCFWAPILEIFFYFFCQKPPRQRDCFWAVCASCLVRICVIVCKLLCCNFYIVVQGVLLSVPILLCWVVCVGYTLCTN